jgi:hypothetical protein
MGPRSACIAAALLAAAPAIAAAQANAGSPAAAAPQLPPQNYGSQPGFFRSATEMVTLENAIQGVPTGAPVQPAPVQPPAPVAPVVPVMPAPAAAAVQQPAERVPDPTQNLQWAERQMDRAETTAVQQRELSRAPPPVAPGAWNGTTDPETR